MKTYLVDDFILQICLYYFPKHDQNINSHNQAGLIYFQQPLTLCIKNHIVKDVIHHKLLNENKVLLKKILFQQGCFFHLKVVRMLQRNFGQIRFYIIYNIFCYVEPWWEYFYKLVQIFLSTKQMNFSFFLSFFILQHINSNTSYYNESYNISHTAIYSQ